MAATPEKAPGRTRSPGRATKDARPGEEGDGFSAEERAAMKERARELRARRKPGDGEAEIAAKIAEMSEPDRSMAQRVHDIVRSVAPGLEPRTWYGMPAYAAGGKVLCFFQPGEKFKARYATLGFNDAARLDDGAMWPTTFALTEIGEAEEARIRELVARAAAAAG